MTVKRIYIAPYVLDRTPEPAAAEPSPNRRAAERGPLRRLLDVLTQRRIATSNKPSLTGPANADREEPVRHLRRPAPRAYRLLNRRLLNRRLHNLSEAAATTDNRANEPAAAVEYLMLETIAPAQLRAGDYLLVEAGEWIEADGVVVDGEALIDASPATGESAAVVRSANGVREVMRNTQVIDGRIFVELTPRLGHPLDWQTA